MAINLLANRAVPSLALTLALASRHAQWRHPICRCSSREFRPINTIATGGAVVLNIDYSLTDLTFAKGQGQMSSDGNHYRFGPYTIDPKQVFYFTNLSFATVNLRPVLPGHVLVCPRREVKRFGDLTAEETSDLWLAAKKVGTQLEGFHKAISITFVIQDGPEAGQTVPHVHIHILPRKGGDFEKNDEIYDKIDEEEKELKQNLDLDEERKDRSLEEMAQEADGYRLLFL